MKAFLVLCEVAALGLLVVDPAPPRLAAGADPGRGLEPAGAGGDRGQRAQRRLRHPAHGGRAGRAGERTAARVGAPAARWRFQAKLLPGFVLARGRAGSAGGTILAVAGAARPLLVCPTPPPGRASGSARCATRATGGSTRRASRALRAVLDEDGAALASALGVLAVAAIAGLAAARARRRGPGRGGGVAGPRRQRPALVRAVAAAVPRPARRAGGAAVHGDRRARVPGRSRVAVRATRGTCRGGSARWSTGRAWPWPSRRWQALRA